MLVCAAVFLLASVAAARIGGDGALDKSFGEGGFSERVTYAAAAKKAVAARERRPIHRRRSLSSRS
ncbi:MAG TPA: hypothetical protein VGC32_20225 [Solirubrobacterales bacterium]